MKKRVFLKYPCGKLFELRMPIMIVSNEDKIISILPTSLDFFVHAKQKFEFNGLKVIELEIEEPYANRPTNFISIHNKKNAIE